VRERARSWCRALGKTAIEVPDQPGFVVNGLLFPFLFESVRLLERTGMDAADIDSCMRLGAGHPMGPLKLLDFVGLDVAAAIGESLHEASGADADRVPERIRALVAEGKLGKKTGAGFYSYE
jgi:3-hydroxyacyl-CoA dehydrogenase